MPCPRCGASDPGASSSCPRCGAPLSFVDEPAPAPLDRALDLDRRGPRALVPPPIVEIPAAEEPRAPAVPVEPVVTVVPHWRRAAAWGVDLVVVVAAAAPPLLLAWLALPAGPHLAAPLVRAAAALALLLGFGYAALAHAVMGATFGKRLLGIQVIGPDGERPGIARSAARAAVAVLGCAALGAGVLAALFTPSRRGLHDLLADTVVIRTP